MYNSILARFSRQLSLSLIGSLSSGFDFASFLSAKCVFSWTRGVLGFGLLALSKPFAALVDLGVRTAGAPFVLLLGFLI